MRSLFLLFSKKRYFAPAWVFASINILLGTWAIYIPQIKSGLQIDAGQLGIAIFFMALGTLTMLAMAPRIIRSLEVGKATAIGIILFSFSFFIAFAGTHYYVLCLGMFVVGALSGFTDVAMNTLVTEIEKEDEVHIMSANHGFFSLGGFLGAGLGGLFLSEVTDPIHHLSIVAVVLLLSNSYLLKSYVGITSEKVESPGFEFRNFRPMVALVVIGFFVMASEGAIVDWSALYLEKISKIEAYKVGLGYTIFSFTMAFGRFLGDGISAKFGSQKLVVTGLFIALIGFVCILQVTPLLALFGFGGVGLGLSVVVPELFRIGGKVKNIDAAQGVSIISGSGFAGFLIGPVFLGLLADLSSLKLSFLALLCFILVSFFFAWKIKKS